jgi:hypothetical protein
MVHLHRKTGNAFAFFNIQNQWGRRKVALLSLLQSFPERMPVIVEDWNFVALNAAALLLIFSAAYRLFKKRDFDFVSTVVLPILSALNTGTVLSCHRYAVTLFPVFIFLADISRNRGSERVLFGLSISLPTILAILLGLHATAAIA